MLQRIRDNASGPIAYVIVGLITVVFGVWGIGSYFTPSADPVVASVGGSEITRYQLQRAYDQRYQRLRQLMGDNFDPSTVEPEQLRRTVLQGLVQRAMLEQYAQQAGYRVTDQALLQAIQSDPRFEVAGAFSAERYRGLLAQAGVTPAAFEARMRNSLVSGQLRAGMTDSAFVSPRGVEQAYDLRNQQRELAYLLFENDAYRDQVQVSDDEIDAYYENHAEQYMREARVKLAYVEVNRNAGDGEAVSEERLRAVYDQNESMFTTPEKRTAEQIFVPASGADAATARERIQEIAARIEQGATFSEVAADMEDTVQSSEIGPAPRSALPEDVGEALFALDQGGVSSPVRAQDGWYLLKLETVQAAETQSFDDPEAKARLETMAREQQAEDRYSERADRLDALAFEAPNSLETVADELDLDIQTTGWMTRSNGENLGQYDAIRKAAFSDAVLKDELNSTPIQLGSDRLVVLRVAESEPAAQLPLEEVAEDIGDRLIERAAERLALEAAEAAREQVAQGKTLGQVAEASGADLQQPGFVTRRDEAVPARIREALFALPRPNEGQMRYDIASTRTGAVALVALRAVRSEGGGADAAEPQFVQQQRAYVAQLEYAAFIEYVRANADVEIQADQIN